MKMVTIQRKQRTYEINVDAIAYMTQSIGPSRATTIHFIGSIGDKGLTF